MERVQGTCQSQEAIAHVFCHVNNRMLIFSDWALIVWYSKCQNTVETSTFGNELIASKNTAEHIEGLRYNLWMFVLIEDPTTIFCDHEAVHKNCS